MSIRENMAKASQEAKEEIQSIEFQIESSQKTLRALKFAQQVLSGQPRAETKCNLSKHYTLTSGYFQKVDCSECGQTVQGWEKSWRYCPLCGSTVIKTEEEANATDRLNRAAVKGAVEAVLNSSNGGK
jgi:ribosomal protein S27E